MKASLALVAVLALAGCRVEQNTRREDHRAFAATPRTVTALSLARSSAGATLASWTESSPEGDDLMWVWPDRGDEPVHRAILGGDPLTWMLSPLLPTPSGFVRLGLGEAGFAELTLGSDGAMQSYEAAPELRDMSVGYRAISVGGEVVLFAPTNGGTTVFRHKDIAWRDAGRVGGVACDSAQFGSEVPFAVTAAPPNRFAYLSVEEGSERECWSRLLTLGLDGTVLSDVTVDGAVVDAGTYEVLRYPLALAAVPNGGLAALWSSPSGGMSVYVVDPEGRFDLDYPSFDAEGAIVANPRLFTTDDRIVVTFQREADGELAPTEAVLLDPHSGVPSKPFFWPVDEASCAGSATLPRGDGVDYACVGRCHGEGCRENWLYHGRVVIP